MKFNEIFMRDRPPPERGAFLEIVRQQKSPRILINNLNFIKFPHFFLLFSLFISETYEIQWPFSSFLTCFLPLLFRKNTKNMSCKTCFSCFSCFLLFSYLKNERKIFRIFELFAQISRLLTAPVFMISHMEDV